VDVPVWIVEAAGAAGPFCFPRNLIGAARRRTMTNEITGGEITAGDLFKKGQSRQDSKAQTTSSIARTIIETERASREAKTAKLREARIAREALELAQQPAKPKKPAPKKRVARQGKA
jgi:hypothetical protein